MCFIFKILTTAKITQVILIGKILSKRVVSIQHPVRACFLIICPTKWDHFMAGESKTFSCRLKRIESIAIELVVVLKLVEHGLRV